MEKIDKLTSEDIVQNNIDKLKEIFPTAFSEGKIVWEELQAALGEYTEKEKEFYQMTWAGKTQAQREANKVSTGTLRPCKEESKDWDTTGNIFIEGDNLEVLKLLQKSYSNKIKMIYIDPPYNTGKDFVYKDNYKDNLSNYLKLTGQTDEEGKKLSTNTDSDGRYHSNWLNMMYPRLKLARNLLTDDGVIFISIDDNEQANLKKLCDEIFGEENFVASIIWKKRGGPPNDKIIGATHDFKLLYSKDLNKVSLFKRERTDDQLKRYSNPDNHPKGLWAADNLMANVKGGRFVQSLHFPITNPETNQDHYPGKDGNWRYNRDKIQKLLDNNEIYFGKDGHGRPKLKRFLSEISEGVPYPTIWDFVPQNNSATKEIEKIFGTVNYFETPKPVLLLREILILGSSKNDIILDFFAGSGTTAHAVMALNAEDGGVRKCISVQLPELTDEKSDDYKTIAEITKERIRRAGELIKRDNADKEGIDQLDIGFRVFKLASSNIQAWDTDIDKLQGQLDVFSQNDGEHLKADRTEKDILFEILLKYGLELTLPIQEKEVAGSKIYNIGFGSMYICLSDTISIEVAKAIGAWHQEFSDANPSVIFKDSGFATDADKTNTIQTLRQSGIENVKSI